MLKCYFLIIDDWLKIGDENRTIKVVSDGLAKEINISVVTEVEINIKKPY